MRTRIVMLALAAIPACAAPPGPATTAPAAPPAAPLPPAPPNDPAAPTTSELAPAPARTASASAECGEGMAFVPGGSLLMKKGEGGEQAESVEVTVAGLCLDVREVSVADYRQCVDAGACSSDELDGDPKTLPAVRAMCSWGKPDRAQHPIDCVDHGQATAYCRWKGKRLPRENEWALAATSGGRHVPYPWGEAAPGAGVCWDGPGNDAGEHERKGTCPAGSSSADRSAQGILDLAGNVREWTASPFCEDPSAECDRPVFAFRGGDWQAHDPAELRVDRRNGFQPDARAYSIGFRCAR